MCNEPTSEEINDYELEPIPDDELEAILDKAEEDWGLTLKLLGEH